MELSAFFKKYDFHDSSIIEFGANEEDQTLYFKIEFCNWRQDDFKEGDPNNILAILIFRNVTNIEITPPLDFFVGNDKNFGDIFRIDTFSKDINNRNCKDSVKISMSMIKYLNTDGKVNEVETYHKILLEASEVIWEPIKELYLDE